MAKMHENELEIDEHLVHTLLKKQCTAWANLPLTPIQSSGTDNALFRLDSKYVVRLPRIEWPSGSIATGINQEYEWPGNIIVRNNRLSAVIDFSDVGIGDPACDLIIAWSLLKPRSRKVFREHLEDIDTNTWERGKGWALSIALIMLPYYKHSNPVLAALARRMIDNVLDDSLGG